MNPIVYNKNGQFRFNDFVGYLPEFLKTEPDVVTLMQVMSDYINNAYRNIETTEEFEFVRVCTSTDQNAVRNEMERLCSMLQLASERGDAVRYLSVPRNNVKSNVIVGNEGAEYAKEAEIDLPEVEDVITSASGRHLVDKTTKDGTVVYIKYRNADPVRTVAYYYSAADDTMIRDTAGTSQDPFTGTDNSPSTAIEFKVSDVGHVLRRYGGQSKDKSVNYYEIFFTIKVTDVNRVSAIDSVLVDVDGIDNKTDQVIVDYYNQAAVADGNYNTYIKFAEGNAFNWVGEYPSGIFYLRDTSSSKLTNVSSSTYVPIPDTALSPNIDRYRVSRIDVDSTGMLKIYTSTGTPGIYSDAMFYLMHGNEQVALLKMNSDITSKSRKEDGELYTYVFPVSLKYDIYDIIGMITDKKSLTLVSIPLSESYYTIDGTNRMPLLRWSGEYRFLDDMSVGLSSDIKLSKATIKDNDVVVRIKGSKWKQIGLREFYSPVDLNVGAFILCPDAWDGIAMVTASKIDKTNGLYRIGIQKNVKSTFHPETSEEIEITIPSVGVITSMSASNAETGEHEYAIYSGYYWQPGDVVLLDCEVNGNAEQRLFRITKYAEGCIHIFHPAYNPETGIGVKIAKNTPMRLVEESTESYVSKVDHVRKLGDDTVAAIRRYTGPIYTNEYMIARFKNVEDDQFCVLKMVSDVVMYDADVDYPDGTYVYKPDDHNVYQIKKSIVMKGEQVLEQTDLILDTVKHFSVGYKKMTNSFMPYAGAVATLDYDEKIDYTVDDMETVRIPLYIKKSSDTHLRYGWKEREYLYYGNDIGVDDMSRAGFVEFYGKNQHNIVDVDMADRAVNVIDEETSGTILKKGIAPVYVIDIDSNLIATKNESGKWIVTMTSAGHGLVDGMRITVSDVVVSDSSLSDVFNVTDAVIDVLSPDVIQYASDSTAEGVYCTGEISDEHDPEHKKATAIYRRPINAKTGEPLQEGDVIEVDRKESDATVREFYKVGIGNWVKLDRHTVLTPFTLYAQQNLIDTSVTNPAYALSQGYKVRRISFIDENTAQVNLIGRVPETDLHKGTRVFIRFADHSAYNGWHTVTSNVNGGGIFNIKIAGEAGMKDGQSLVGREMTLYVGMWYKYTVYAYDWNKVSNQATFATSNEILEVNGKTVRTKYKHGLSVGDSVIIDSSGEAAYSYEGGEPTNIYEAVVTAVPSDESVVVEGDASIVAGGRIYKGFVARENVGNLNGEFTWKGHRFTDGEIVYTTNQLCEDEEIAWRVSKSSAWVPMRKKRTFKIDNIEVEMYRNPEFDEADPVETDSEYKYRVYGDNFVEAEAENGNAYLQAAGMSRNYHFEHPHMENLDTTQDVKLQYSSKYDYGTVAPRDDMDASFRGVPDMDYPLAERIERLAYLKDASVLDFDLIGYLARFMGYDITAVSDDVSESGVYRTNEERENALRETISHLPQYYALNGTKAGINMLMATFGLVGELITMWTNTDDPYGELVRQTDIDERIQKDSGLGIKVGQWVPTPHVVLDVLDEPKFPSVSVTNEDIERIKEQIRCCKPINVVFDGIRVVMKAVATAGISIVAHGMEGSSGLSPVFDGNNDEGLGLESYEEDACLDDDCGF